jgi:hypothetical protein
MDIINSSITQITPVIVSESANQRSLYYHIMEWKEETDKSLLQLVTIPSDLSSDITFYNQIITLYSQSLDLSKFDIIWRKQIGGCRPIVSLSSSSQSRYSIIVAQFVLFMKRKIELEDESEFKRFFSSLLSENNEFTKDSLFQLLLYTIKEKPISSQSKSTMLTQFYYLLCHEQDGTFTRPDKLTHYCSYIKYMIKVTLLHR